MPTRRNDFDNPVDITQGGTSADNPDDARDNLGITIGARTIVGTMGEIEVTNGDGLSGDPTISIETDPVLPGGGAVTPPIGATLQQPVVPAVGMLRGNSDTGLAEIYSDGSWRPQGREIQGTANQITVTNGDGISADPTISISDDPILPGTGAVLVPQGTTAQRPGTPLLGMIRGNSDTNQIEAYTSGAWAGFVFLQNYLTGLIQDVTTVTTMTFNPGQCANHNNTTYILSPSSFVKDISANWAAGTGNGGFPSALTLSNNTPYLTFIIAKDDGTVDFGFDTSTTATNLLADAGPSGFIYYRRIGSCRTQVGSTNLETIYQHGDYFYYETQREDFTTNYVGIAIINSVVPLSLPNNISIIVATLVNSTRESAGGGENTRAYAMPTVTTGLANNYLTNSVPTGGSSAAGVGLYNIPTSDATVRIYADVHGGAVNGGIFASTLGWYDRRDQ